MKSFIHSFIFAVAVPFGSMIPNRRRYRERLANTRTSVAYANNYIENWQRATFYVIMRWGSGFFLCLVWFGWYLFSLCWIILSRACMGVSVSVAICYVISRLNQDTQNVRYDTYPIGIDVPIWMLYNVHIRVAQKMHTLDFWMSIDFSFLRP